MVMHIQIQRTHQVQMQRQRQLKLRYLKPEQNSDANDDDARTHAPAQKQDYADAPIIGW